MSNLTDRLDQEAEQLEADWDKRWEEFWKPLLINDKGELDEQLVKNEIHDLQFIFEQVSKVYCEITGNKLSKPMYWASTIIAEYEEQIQEAYDEGIEHGKEIGRDEHLLSEDAKEE